MYEESLSMACWECLITCVDQLGAEELNSGNILNQDGLIYYIFLWTPDWLSCRPTINSHVLTSTNICRPY